MINKKRYGFYTNGQLIDVYYFQNDQAAEKKAQWLADRLQKDITIFHLNRLVKKQIPPTQKDTNP